MPASSSSIRNSKASITGEQKEEKSEALIVSWSSLEKRKAEYEELVNKKIPENSKEIGVARSYGDLRENFEFKAAKEMQAVLMRRKSELEAALHRARGTAFENPDTTQVSIGTIVTLCDSDSGQEETYTVLGAWDGDPERRHHFVPNGDWPGVARTQDWGRSYAIYENETRRLAITSIVRLQLMWVA